MLNDSVTPSSSSAIVETVLEDAEGLAAVVREESMTSPTTSLVTSLRRESGLEPSRVTLSSGVLPCDDVEVEDETHDEVSCSPWGANTDTVDPRRETVKASYREGSIGCTGRG